MNLLGTSVLSAMQTAFKILAGFVLVKVVALAAGPEGVAQLGQFQNLVAVMAVLSGGMFYTGVTKLIAEQAEHHDRASTIIYAALRASLFCFVCLLIITAIWHQEIAADVLKDGSLASFVFVLPVLVFLSVLNGLWLAVLNGYRRVRELVLASIAGSLLMIVLTIALALPFGEVGAYVAILAPPAIVLFVLFGWRFSKPRCAVFSATGKEQPPYHELGRFALMGLVSAIAAPVAQMIMREYLVDNLSLNEAGIWQGVTRISEVYLVFITSSLSVYFLPKLAQVKGRIELIDLIRSVLRAVIPVAIVMGVMIYFVRDILIYLLFTPEFNSMRDLFVWQIFGDFVKIISWVFGYIILVRGSVLWFVFGEVVFNATYVIFGVILVPKFGVDGAIFAYALNYIVYLSYVVFVSILMIKKFDG